MTKTSWLTLWGGLFILCGGLGFIPAPTGFLKVLLIALSLGFFVPPAILLRTAAQKKDKDIPRLIRNLSLGSLGLTVAVLIANFLSIMAPEAVGVALYVMLVLISTPMVCSQYWVIGLFGWACLLMVSLSLLRKKRA